MCATDVDDMQNVADLEQYIEQSACILCFLSQGYLASKNCLREIREAVSMSKPRINVHEADPRKGGATLTEMRDKDCPPELRDALEARNQFSGTELQLLSWSRKSCRSISRPQHSQCHSKCKKVAH